MMRHAVTILAILSCFSCTGPVSGKEREGQAAAKSMEAPRNDSSPQNPQGAYLEECGKHSSPECRQTFAKAMDASFRKRFPDLDISAEDVDKKSFVYTSVTQFSSSEKRLANWKALHADFKDYLCDLGFERIVMRKQQESTVTSDQDEFSLDCSSTPPGKKTGEPTVKKTDAISLSEANRHVSSSYEPAQKATHYQPTLVNSYDAGGHKIKVYPYLVKEDNGRARLRLKGVVTGRDQVFVQRIKVIVDGTDITIALDPATEIVSKSSEGPGSTPNAEVQETIDFENRNDFIQQIARAKHVYFSFEGKTPGVEFHLKPSDVQNFAWIETLYKGGSTP
jgi:hypothetical protein